MCFVDARSFLSSFFFNDTATTEIYTLSLHDALPIYQTFPTLTPDQIARVAAHGHVRPIRTGEVLFEAGDAVRSFFLVTAGQIEMIRPSYRAETLVVAHGPGQVTGEGTMLSGRPAMAPARGAEPGGVVEADPDRPLSL